MGQGDTIGRLIDSIPDIVIKFPQPSLKVTTYEPHEEKPQHVITIESIHHENEPRPAIVIPPQDKGRAAILVLIAIVLVDSATYGFTLTYGVFQEYYHSQFADFATASWIGVLSGGVPYLGAPAVTWCCQTFKIPREFYIFLGVVLCIISLLMSAFITSIPGLIISQGLLYGTGTLLVSIPELIVLNTWFDKHRGIAYGIVFASADVFGVAYTFIAAELLNRYGLRTTMLVFSGMTLAVAGPAVMILRERPHPDAVVVTSASNPSRLRRSSTISVKVKRAPTEEIPFSPSIQRQTTWKPPKPRKHYYQRTVFYMFNLLNFLQSAAWYLPFIYLPSFVTGLGYSKHTAATVLAVGNFTMIIGDLAFGQLSDKVHVNTLIVTCTSVSAVSTFVLWGFVGTGTQSLAAIYAFIAVFSCFGGGFVALWARMGTIFGEKEAQTVYSTLCFGRGVGGILSGPISQVLLKNQTPKALQVLGKGPYGGIIMFVGMCTAGAAIVGVCAIIALWRKNEKAREEHHRELESGSQKSLD